MFVLKPLNLRTSHASQSALCLLQLHDMWNMTETSYTTCDCVCDGNCDCHRERVLMAIQKVTSVQEANALLQLVFKVGSCRHERDAHRSFAPVK